MGLFDHVDEDTSAITNWFDAGVAKVCLVVTLNSVSEFTPKEKLVICRALIRTRAEFHGEPTFTCLAFISLAAEDIDPLTGELLCT